MNAHDGLERRLTTWLADVAAPSVPDYTNEIVQLTARQRQRPRWTFTERWLPMHMNTLERVPTRPVPWRTIGSLAVIGLLTAALLVVALGVGRAPPTPAPFGLAGNGLIAYARNGDIMTVDPSTGAREAVVTGPETDHDPRWSPDGTRLAFLRVSHQEPGGNQLVIVDAAGAGTRVISSDVLIDADDDSVRWAPDGRSIVVVHGSMRSRQIGLVDTEDGRITNLDVSDFDSLEVFWRPPDGRELLYVTHDGSSGGLSIVSMDDGRSRAVPLPPEVRDQVRAMGWTPDGSRILVHHWSAGARRDQTSVIDPETGGSTVLEVAFGHVSNSGTRVAGLTNVGAPVVCVIDIGGGACEPISQPHQAPDGAHGEGLQWSPDDEWVVVQPGTGAPPVLLDPDPASAAEWPGWVSGGAESWQRKAP